MQLLVCFRLNPCLRFFNVYRFGHGRLRIGAEYLITVLIAVESSHHQLRRLRSVGYAWNVVTASRRKLNLLCLTGLHIVAVKSHGGVCGACYGVFVAPDAWIKFIFFIGIACAGVMGSVYIGTCDSSNFT